MSTEKPVGSKIGMQILVVTLAPMPFGKCLNPSCKEQTRLGSFHPWLAASVLIEHFKVVGHAHALKYKVVHCIKTLNLYSLLKSEQS